MVGDKLGDIVYNLGVVPDAIVITGDSFAVQKTLFCVHLCESVAE